MIYFAILMKELLEQATDIFVMIKLNIYYYEGVGIKI